MANKKPFEKEEEQKTPAPTQEPQEAQEGTIDPNQ
jgi:hypothetical protein